MKQLWCSLIILFFLSLSSAYAQSVSSTSSTPRLFIKDITDKGSYIEIIYEINKPGFVELHLFNSDREKLWIKGKVTDRIGLAKIRVPTKPLVSGQRYPFVLKYKGKDYNRTIFY
ncbi:MAG: hypothetical protein AAFW00_07750 [Bacteroidota bacterium]